jgi:hypothetical protein
MFACGVRKRLSIVDCRLSMGSGTTEGSILYSTPYIPGDVDGRLYTRWTEQSVLSGFVLCTVSLMFV